MERQVSNRRKDIVPPQAKVAANYTGPAFAKWRARRDGFDDILLLNASGTVAESTTSNLFAVINGGLATPGDENVLLGVTRASIVELSAALGIPCAKRELTVADLLAADEAVPNLHFQGGLSGAADRRNTNRWSCPRPHYAPLG